MKFGIDTFSNNIEEQIRTLLGGSRGRTAGSSRQHPDGVRQQGGSPDAHEHPDDGEGKAGAQREAGLFKLGVAGPGQQRKDANDAQRNEDKLGKLGLLREHDHYHKNNCARQQQNGKDYECLRRLHRAAASIASATAW